jgi:hypothetical protein
MRSGLRVPVRRRRSTAAAWIAAAALAVPGCGRNRVTVDVDVASFMAPEDLSGPYQVLAGAPTLQFDLPALPITMEGTEDLSQAESVEIDAEVRFDNQSGQGLARFTLFLAGAEAGLYDTPAVAAAEAPLAPATASLGAAHVQGDARVLDLFRSGQMWVGIRWSLQPDGAAELAGTYTITRLHAKVVTRLDLL